MHKRYENTFFFFFTLSRPINVYSVTLKKNCGYFICMLRVISNRDLDSRNSDPCEKKIN